MAQVFEDIEAGGDFQQTTDTLTTTRLFRVTGVAGEGYLRTRNAALAVGTNGVNVPRIGQAHPSSVMQGAVVQDVRAVPVRGEHSVFDVTVFYSNAPTGTLSLDDEDEVLVDLIQIDDGVTFDVGGNPIETEYTDFIGTVTRDVHRVQVQRPGAQIRISKTIATSPLALTLAYGGKVNSSNWGPYGPKVIRCDGFSVSRTSGSLSRVSGLFIPSPALRGDWLAEVETREQWWLNGSNQPPTIQSGKATADVYEAVDFNASGFVLPPSW